jgi:hypothetical protein
MGHLIKIHLLINIILTHFTKNQPHHFNSLFHQQSILHKAHMFYFNNQQMSIIYMVM